MKHAWCNNCKRIVPYNKINHSRKLVIKCNICETEIGYMKDNGDSPVPLGRPKLIKRYYRMLCRHQKIRKNENNYSKEINEETKEKAKLRAKKMYKEHSDNLFGVFSPVKWYPKKKNKESK